MKTRKFLLLAIVSMLTLLPFLGLTDYNTKGEPREAIVAYSMIDSGNWILPVNNGGEMAYKPPFFHWCIAVCSTFQGFVNEYSSRLPSAMALILMVWGGFFFYCRRFTPTIALLTAFITLTNFETHRAGMNCRVDMVLTALIVGALYAFYHWYERRCKGIPWLAVLLMSGATLTKGPVGILLPCMVAGAFLWMRAYNFWNIVGRMTVIALLSCVLPAAWYIAAYQQGGDEFITLVLEENVGRFMGKMTYESHENPAYYNVFTVLAGYAPYTLLVLLSLFFLKWEKPNLCLRETWNRIRQMDDVRLFSLLSIVIIFVFYCIPKSKRSVYLLPIYPFMAFFLAKYIVFLAKEHANALRVYGSILSGIALLLFGVFCAIRNSLIPESIFHGKHAVENIGYMTALHDISLTTGHLILLGFLILIPVYFLMRQARMRNTVQMSYVIIGITFVIFLCMDGLIQPTVLNVKSDKPIAMELQKRIPEGKIYSYVSAEMLHFFTINFYNDNRVAVFDKEEPESGYLLVGMKDYAILHERYKEDYRFEEEWNTHKRSCDVGDSIMLYRFEHRKALRQETIK